MLVKDLMSTDVVTVSKDRSLRDAVAQLLENDVGSTIVVDEAGQPIGIITETDVLRATYKTDKPLSEIPVSALSHRPLVTTKPSSTVTFVAKKMSKKGVKKVPVMEDLDLVGIITLSDIVWHLSDIRSEAVEFAETNKKWGPD